ncbi:MAG TPA: hypothetical protein VGI87_16110 [Solirubrobacteraceae bacterium]|jgi:hypothetical protein
MNAFEVVVVVVCVIALLVAAAAFFRGNGAFDRFGRRGSTWFDHNEDIAADDRPSEDDRDDPIPKRPLRGRPQ